MNYAHRTIGELLQYMTEEARDQYRRLERQHKEVERQLEELDE